MAELVSTCASYGIEDRTVALQDLRYSLVTSPQTKCSTCTYTEDLVTGDDLDLGNTVAVTEDNTDLGGGSTAFISFAPFLSQRQESLNIPLLGELADLVNDLVGSGLQPAGGSARVGESGGRNALSLGVKTTHCD